VTDDLQNLMRKLGIGEPDGHREGYHDGILRGFEIARDHAVKILTESGVQGSVLRRIEKMQLTRKVP
jgi:hypothetical protein